MQYSHNVRANAQRRLLSARVARQFCASVEVEPSLPPWFKGMVTSLAASHMSACPDGDWGFCMLSPDECARVVHALRRLPSDSFPVLCERVFFDAFMSMEWETGRVTKSVAELSEVCGSSPKLVSEALGTMSRMGIFSRSYGAGNRVSYAVNPYVVWRGSLGSRASRAVDCERPHLRVAGGTDARRPAQAAVLSSPKKR